jgi:predicted Zn-ribbon and HTH transcriptional regulator
MTSGPQYPPEWDEDEKRCPNCGSDDVHETKTWLKTWLCRTTTCADCGYFETED